MASIPVNWLPLPMKKLPETFPVADTTPPVTTLPAFTLPEILAVVAKTVLFAIKLLAMMLPVSLIEALSPPVVKKLMYPEGPAAR